MATKSSNNCMREHEGLKGKTPAEVWGITVRGKNKWIIPIRNASKYEIEDWLWLFKFWMNPTEYSKSEPKIHKRFIWSRKEFEVGIYNRYMGNLLPASALDGEKNGKEGNI